MSRRAWWITGALLLLVAAIAAMQIVAGGPSQDPTGPVVQTSGRPANATPGARPAPSAACSELLARICSCSVTELDGVADKLGGMEALLLYRQLTVTDRQEVFAALPPPLLARKAKELLGIPEDSFRHDGSAGRIASSLVEVAMGLPVASAPQQRRELCFATGIDEQHVPQSPRGAFRPDERRIYACLDAGADPVGEPGVLVRWSEEGSGALVYLNYLPFALNRSWNHVYFEVTEAWTPGRYRVGFYRIGESVSLLAEGTYTVGAAD